MKFITRKIKDKYSYIKYNSLHGPENGNKHHEPLCSRYTGFLLAILASLSEVATAFVVKSLPGYTTSEIIAYRTLCDMVMSVPFLVKDSTKLTILPVAGLIVFRSVMATFRFYFRVFAIQALPLTDTNVILSCTPPLVALLSIIVLKERFTNAMSITLLTSVVGVCMVTQIWDLGNELSNDRALGLGAAFLSVIFHSVAQVLLKKLTFDLSPEWVVFLNASLRHVYMVMLTEISNGFNWPRLPKCGTYEPVLVVLMGLTAYGQKLLMVKAIKLETASICNAIRYSVILPVFLILQWFVFQQTVSTLMVTGVFVCIFGVVLMSFAKIVEKIPQDSKRKQFFSWLNN